MSARPDGYPDKRPDQEPEGRKGPLRGNKWLLLRRCSQVAALGLFLSGPLWGVWILKGNLASSRIARVPLTDPFVALQSLVAGHLPARDALVGVAVVGAFYLLVGGRVYCSWVCPVNPVADVAAWTGRRLSVKPRANLSPALRYWVMGGALSASLATGTIAWEWVNPVTILHRGLVFGLGLGWFLALSVFLFDAFLVRRGWCGHLCPVGAFYGLFGFAALWRVRAEGRARCNDCGECFAVCPEPQVIVPALKGVGSATPLVLSPNCVNCGRCIDVCAQDVFRFSTRFTTTTEELP